MKHGKIIIGAYTYQKDDDLSEVEKITGGIDASGADTRAAFPRLTSVGGYIYASGADTRAAFPRLTSVGGYIDASGAEIILTKKLKQNDPSVKLSTHDKLFNSFLKNNLLYADNILAEIISKKGNVYKIIITGKTEVSYCIKYNDSFSHGKTIREAKRDWIYKIGNRDTTRFKIWKLNTKITLKEALESYRVITGACEQGTKNFVEKIKTKKYYTVKEVIEATIGQWGNESYSKFFTELTLPPAG
jgi:uncharacterized protein (DUF1919 family)